MSFSGSRLISGFKQFFRQKKLSKQDKVTFIGQDHFGNKYFEAQRPNHLSRQFQRYFERTDFNPESANIVDVSKVPPAWDAWLRFRRQAPPSEEEIQDGEDYFAMQQARAAGLKPKEQQQDLESTIGGTTSRSLPKKREFPKLPFNDSEKNI